MTPNEAFDNYMRSLSNKERIAKSRDLRTICKKSSSVISDWRCGRSRIDIAWQAKISEVIGRDIFADCES